LSALDNHLSCLRIVPAVGGNQMLQMNHGEECATEIRRKDEISIELQTTDGYLTNVFSRRVEAISR
jgi:hypothetical protein